MQVKRIYDQASPKDGYRVLVDRIWPRGMSKETAALDEWNKEIAPTTELRKWFNHIPERFVEFKTKYKEELSLKNDELQRLKAIDKKQNLTLLYSAKDLTNNQAVVLLDVLKNLD